MIDMKFILFLMLPLCGTAQIFNKPVLSGDITKGVEPEIICTRTHIDTVKNVEWYVEVRADTGIMGMPMSVGCRGCSFIHTYNDLSKESHWYELYHDKKDSWAYYIHEVNVVALKQKDGTIIYPNKK